MADQAQTPEELAAHFGPGGPVAAASDWLAAVLARGIYAAAWGLISDDLRLARAQAWLWNNREFFQKAAEDLDEQAGMLAAAPSAHPDRDGFTEIELGMFIEAFPPEEYANVGISSRPRPLAPPGLELVCSTFGWQTSRRSKAQRLSTAGESSSVAPVTACL